MRTTGKWAAIAGLLLVGTLGTKVDGQATGTAPGKVPPPAPPPIVLPLTSLKPEASIDAGGDRHITVTTDAVWVSNRAAGTLARIDPKTHFPGSPVAAGKEPCQPVVSAFKSLWVAQCGTPGLARIDVSGADAPPVAVAVSLRQAGPLATGAGSIWMVTDAAGTLARIDPDTNAAVAEITVPAGVSAITFGLGSVWVTSSTLSSVTRVNGDTNVVVETIAVGRSPLSVAVGEGSVWTMNGGDGTVSRIDPKTNKVVETIKSGVTAATGTMVVGEGSVWLSAPGTPLTRIDPVTNRMAQQFTGPVGGPIAIGLKSIWVAATRTAIWRIDPRRVEATRK